MFIPIAILIGVVTYMIENQLQAICSYWEDHQCLGAQGRNQWLHSHHVKLNI